MDPNYYLINGTDVHEAQLDPAEHFCRFGWREGRKPNIYFDTRWYRQTNPMVERLKAFSPTPLFDVTWYVEQHADGLAGNLDPSAHFLQAGTYHDIDPSPSFSAAEYRRRHLGRPSRQFTRLMHPDRDNPLVHHLRAEYR